MPKVRDSGMPAIEQWESYFDPVGILEFLGRRDVSGDASSMRYTCHDCIRHFPLC